MAIYLNGTEYQMGSIVISGGSSAVIEHEHLATPSETEQLIEPSTGYDAMDSVRISAIPSSYIGSAITRKAAATITPSETAQTIAAGQYLEGAQTISAIPSNYIGSGITQKSAATYTPTESQQTIAAGQYLSGAQTIAAIPSSYIGSGITQRSSSSISQHWESGYQQLEVNIPAGYYSQQVLYPIGGLTLPTSAASSATSGYTSKATISRSTSAQYINISTGYNYAGAYYTISATPNGAVTAPSTISGTSATVSTGTNTLTLSKTVSVTPNVTTEGYISSGTAGNAEVSLTASVTTQAAQTIYPSTSDQTIAASRYLTGAQTIKAVTTSNLTADNIKSGVTVTVGDSADADRILSVVGTYAGGGGGIGTLLATQSIGSVNTTSTQAASLNVSVSVSSINNYDLLIVESSVNTVTNGRHTATIGLIFLTASSSASTKNGATIATAKLNSKNSSTGTTTTSVSTTAYGIYPNSCTISDGSASIPMYRRYNSTSTGTINGTYTTRVYGVNLLNLIGG